MCLDKLATEVVIAEFKSTVSCCRSLLVRIKLLMRSNKMKNRADSCELLLVLQQRSRTASARPRGCFRTSRSFGGGTRVAFAQSLDQVDCRKSRIGRPGWAHSCRGSLRGSECGTSPNQRMLDCCLKVFIRLANSFESITIRSFAEAHARIKADNFIFKLLVWK